MLFNVNCLHEMYANVCQKMYYVCGNARSKSQFMMAQEKLNLYWHVSVPEIIAAEFDCQFLILTIVRDILC